jgi:hypothetical protein
VARGEDYCTCAVRLILQLLDRLRVNKRLAQGTTVGKDRAFHRRRGRVTLDNLMFLDCYCAASRVQAITPKHRKRKEQDADETPRSTYVRRPPLHGPARSGTMSRVKGNFRVR